MSLKENIMADMKTAMRDKDIIRLETIRLLRSAIQRKEVDERIALDDARVQSIIQKMIKQSTDAARQFTAGNRPDLADKENLGIGILRTYLPEPLSEAEIKLMVTEAISESSATSVKDMGKVLGLVKTKSEGRADMGVVSMTVKSLLS